MTIEWFTNPLMFLMLGSSALFAVAVLVGAVKVMRADATQQDHVERLSLLPSRDALVAAKEELSYRKDELANIEGRINELIAEEAEIRQNAVDAKHWEALAQSTKEAYENLADKRAEVESVRDDYEEAKKDMAELHQVRDELIRDRDSLQSQIGDIEARREEAEKINAEIDEQSDELDRIKHEISEQEDLRDERERARIALDQLTRMKADIEKELSELPDKVEELEARRDSLSEELEELNDQMRDRLRLLEEVKGLEARKAALAAQIEQLVTERDGIPFGVRTAGGESGSLTQEQIDKALEDLWAKPSCLFDGDAEILDAQRSDISEEEALGEVANYLEELGLYFEDKLIKRFHTSLKISRVSPLTVLAGISGTGKSLLPQRYAEAMGIPFLKVPVQPRWDSPQDLLGFYNYLEKKYKATDLARALAYVDPQSLNEKQIDPAMDDRMLLVLMDEMNLARIEYYFSEFLSRLENRPAPDADGEDRLRPSRIEIDVPIGEGQSVSIYPGHNTLFVGTMNEDESTQALSDKVLDRGNAIRFDRPEKFADRIEDDEAKSSDEYLAFETWQSWYRAALPDDQNNRLKDLVDELQGCLVELGRPFGHRVFHAIAAYAANYPGSNDDDALNTALTDMMELRILPKLRGIELDRLESQAIRNMASFVENTLGDDDLAQRILLSIGNDEMFTWRG
jgi:hypothetical protein